MWDGSPLATGKTGRRDLKASFAACRNLVVSAGRHEPILDRKDAVGGVRRYFCFTITGTIMSPQ